MNPVDGDNQTADIPLGGMVGVDPPLTIRFRDFLFPARLLERTGWRENPLIIHSERRMGRLGRRVLRHLLEIVLLLLGWYFITRAWPGLPSRSGFRGSYDVLGRLASRSFLESFHSILPLLLAFLLLRYHLLLGDRAHQTKSLDRDQLAHLLLTRLGRNQFFLHHFLLFCLHYWVLVGYAVLFAFVMFRPRWKWTS